MHNLHTGTDVFSQAGLDDHQEIRTCEFGSALSPDLLTTGDVNYINRQSDELRTESRAEISPPLSTMMMSNSGQRLLRDSIASTM